MHQIEIIGAPVACKEGVKDTWREVAVWTSNKLKSYYGNEVHVLYYDLFDATLPAMPINEPLPIVLVDGIVVSCGGKISVPLIRKKIQELDSGQPLKKQ